MAYRRALQRQAKREALPAGSLRQHSEGDSAGTSFGFDNDAVLKFCSLSLQYTGCATPDDLKLTPTGTQRTGRHHQPIVTSRVMQLIDPAEMTEKQLLQWFESIDLDHNGQLDILELQKALATGNLHLNLAVIAHMIRIHNHGRSDCLSCQEFYSLHGFLTDIQQSFQYFGQSHAGQLQKAEAMEALQHAGFQLDESAFTTLFRTFSLNQSDWLSIAQYVAMTLFLQSASATFEAFDRQKSGVISLNFNQWIYASANVM